MQLHQKKGTKKIVILLLFTKHVQFIYGLLRHTVQNVSVLLFSRFLRKNMVLWGIWQEKGKPAMHAFQRPLVMALNKMSDKCKYFVFSFY